MSYDFVTTHGPRVQDWYLEKDKSIHRGEWRKQFQAPAPLLRELMIPTPDIDISALPPHCAVLTLAFRLEKPYISRDNTDFDILDNPVRKEWIFKTPEVASTGWKGAFRAALGQLGHARRESSVVRLVGPPRPSDGNANDEEELSAGALIFFPTFFNPDDVTLEMINPHNRERGKGTVPIPLECVRAGAQGTLTIVYVPAPGASPEGRSEDLALLVEATLALLTVYGFGAKTSSGFGIARPGQGKLAINTPLNPPGEESMPTAEIQLARYLSSPGILADGFRATDGSLVDEEEYRLRIREKGGSYTKSNILLYEKAKKWWESEGSRVTKRETLPTAESIPATSTWHFLNEDELRRAAADIAAQINPGGDQ